MVTSLVVTPQGPSASVAVQVAGAPAGQVAITRTDVNGTNPVRTRQGQAPIAGAMTVIDYEPALIGAVAYDVVDSGGARVTASTSLAGLVTQPRITGVQLPQQSVVAELITGYDAAREGGSTVHRIIGRGDPIVVLGPTRTREGRLEVWCRTYADALAAMQTLSVARQLILRQPTYPGMDMYFVATNARTVPLDSTADGWRWQATCDYIETRSPALPLLGAAGWTFGDVVAHYPTFAAVRAAFTDFGDLVIGP